MVEYALLASLIAVAAISAVREVGFQSRDILQTVGEEMACAGVAGSTCGGAAPIR